MKRQAGPIGPAFFYHTLIFHSPFTLINSSFTVTVAGSFLFILRTGEGQSHLGLGRVAGRHFDRVDFVRLQYGCFFRCLTYFVPTHLGLIGIVIHGVGGCIICF